MPSLGQIVNRFSPVITIDRAKITTRKELFQGRQTAFSQETVDKIVREGFDVSQEPIAVWQDPDSGMYIVISGHSRWHASQVLFDRGQKNLAMMPVKVFQGTLEEAVDYAVLESNRSGTAEGLLSDLAAYKRAKSKGYTKEKMLGIFKTEANVRKLEDLSYLNPKGRFMEYMDSESSKSFPWLERNAQWVGMLRKRYPQLTDSHEREIFEYFYTTGKASKIKLVSKDQFVNDVEKRITTMYFDPAQPLNLNNMPSVSAYSSQIKQALEIAQRELEQMQTLRAKKEYQLAEAIKMGKESLVQQFRMESEALGKQIVSKLTEIDKIRRDGRMLENSVTADLFSMPANEPGAAPRVERKPAPVPLPRNIPAIPAIPAKNNKLAALKAKAQQAMFAFSSAGLTGVIAGIDNNFVVVVNADGKFLADDGRQLSWDNSHYAVKCTSLADADIYMKRAKNELGAHNIGLWSAYQLSPAPLAVHNSFWSPAKPFEKPKTANPFSHLIEDDNWDWEDGPRPKLKEGFVTTWADYTQHSVSDDPNLEDDMFEDGYHPSWGVATKLVSYDESGARYAITGPARTVLSFLEHDFEFNDGREYLEYHPELFERLGLNGLKPKMRVRRK